jgi:hypothetical protein
MNKIKLPKGEWFYDPNKPLGPEGGFGIVFNGQSTIQNYFQTQRGCIAVSRTTIQPIQG